MAAPILLDVESFLAREGMSATKFGLKALRDRHLVRQLRSGRRMWPETEAKVRTFMAEYRPTEAEAA